MRQSNSTNVAGVAAACSRVVALEQPLVMYRQHDSNVIGGVKLGLGQTIRHSRGTPPQEFDLEILRSLKLAERLRTLPDTEAIRRGIDVIQSKLDHLKARRSMFDRPFFSGLPVIAGELLSFRYAEFSSGLSSSLVDLFRLGVRYNLKSRVGHR